MKKHFVITHLSSAYYGFGLAVNLFGIKAGLGFWLTTIIFSTALIQFVIVAFTSMQDIKDIIAKNDKQNNRSHQ